MKRFSAFHSASGFTLIEVLVAMTVMLIGTVSALALIDRANATTTTTKSREAATSLARELAESVRGVSYDRLTANSVLPELAAQPGLGDSAPGGEYTIVRRDVTFTVTGTVCVMDDARDGGGDQTGGGFCPGSAAPSKPPDRNPEDYKRATLTVAWERDGVARSVTQTAMLNNPGAAGAPSIRSIEATNTPLPVTNPSLSTVQLSIVTSSPAASVNWLLDGSVRAPAPTGNASGTTWTAYWDISAAVDGTYIVGAEAFDQYGVSGPNRQLTVQLNRFAPQPPAGVSGGRNRFGDVEIEWAGNAERDIIGYEVRRGSEVVCSLEDTGMSTECLDQDPPNEQDGSVVYSVYAYDRAPTGSQRESAASDTTVISGNLEPGVPANLRQGEGAVTLTWEKPSPEDAGPPGDGVYYYRVYRDGKGYSNRYARWFDSGATVSWTDPDPDGMTHTYWVTAVDTNYMESSFAGGVTVG